MFGLTEKLSRKEVAIINAAAGAVSAPRPIIAEVAVIEAPTAPVAPPKMAVPTPAKTQSRAEELAEYAQVAQALGLTVPELEIERFRAVLAKLDYPIYSLKEVVTYMDDKSQREGLGHGWRWLALREKDRYQGEFDGKHPDDMFDRQRGETASDLYRAATNWGPWPLYSHTVPLRALQRIAAIEANYDKPAHFMVTEYAPAPQFAPDPFLMVVIPNPQLSRGVGRFVIDFWDEPGFGIASMLK